MLYLLVLFTNALTVCIAQHIVVNDSVILNEIFALKYAYDPYFYPEVSGP